MSYLLSRRQFLGATTTAAITCALPWTLGGCTSSSGNANLEGPSADEGASGGVAFDPASFTVPDALGNTYQQALEKIQEIAPDAVLFALRFSHVAAPDQPINWDYMFASQKELKYYIVFTGNVVSASELGDCTMKFAEWANVPAVDAITVDAAAAYQNVADTAVAMAEPESLYAYLILYSEEADTAASEYSYVDEPLTWYFEFELAGQADQTDASASNESAPTENAPEDAPAHASGESANTTLVAYAVNAETGETRCVTE